MKILITGASGFVGKALISSLAEDKCHTLHATSRDKVNSLGHYNADVKWHFCNLLDSYSVSNLIKSVKPEVLVQLAWCAKPGAYWTDPANLKWVSANNHIAQQFVLNGGRRILFIGSSAEYLWTDAPILLNELTSPLVPSSLYGSCKAASYMMINSFLTANAISWAWIRLFNLFGSHENPTRLIPKVITKLSKNKSLKFDSALNQRDFIHVSDAASAINNIIKSNTIGPINVASGCSLTVRDVILKIASLMGKINNVTFANDSLETMHVLADVRRLREEIGWIPQSSIDLRLQQACNWWLSNSRQA